MVLSCPVRTPPHALRVACYVATQVKLSLMYRNEYIVWAEKEREARRARDASPLKSLTRLRSRSSEDPTPGSDTPPKKCCVVS